MQPYYCTVYAHRTGFDQIVVIIRKVFPTAATTIESQQGFEVVYIELKGGLFRSSKKLKLSYRERRNPSFELTHAACPVTKNLIGMLAFVSSLPAQNEAVHSSLLNKIRTVNIEVSVFADSDSALEFADLTKQLAESLDAIVFAQPHTAISQSVGQHFLDHRLQLVLDVNGKSAVQSLPVNIDSVWFDSAKRITEDQFRRKARTENFLRNKGIQVNENLPAITSDADVVIRAVTEVKERVVALALTNLVAFNSITGEQALHLASTYNIEHLFTIRETEFLVNPTEERKSHETWKCEGIWTLLWALQVVPDLTYPDQLADLNNIPADQYPVRPGIDPHEFINSLWVLRTPAELLDAADLYYRMDWACVEARTNGVETSLLSGVVFERHYALNWLLSDKNQTWDDIRTDT